MSGSVATVTPPAAAITGPRSGLPMSPFHVAALAFQRARQLQAGARPRVESASRSPARLAVLEVLADAVSWTVEPKAENAPERDRQ
jgi:DNA-directed RNA polymerase subunit K/omega